MRWVEIVAVEEGQSKEIERQVRCRAANEKIAQAARDKYDANIKQRDAQDKANNKIAAAQATLRSNSTS